MIEKLEKNYPSFQKAFSKRKSQKTRKKVQVAAFDSHGTGRGRQKTKRKEVGYMEDNR